VKSVSDDKVFVEEDASGKLREYRKEDLVVRSSMSGERDERALHAGEESKEAKF
jgi:hypothetical protein